IFFWTRTNFREKQPRQIGRAVNLFECRFHNWTERVMRQPPQRNVRRRSRETFSARQFNRGHSQPPDITRVTDRAHCDPIVNLENLLARAPKRDKQNTVAITDRRNRTPLRELGLDVLAPVRDRFYPTIWFFNHMASKIRSSTTMIKTKTAVAGNSRSK